MRLDGNRAVHRLYVIHPILCCESSLRFVENFGWRNRFENIDKTAVKGNGSSVQTGYKNRWKTQNDVLFSKKKPGLPNSAQGENIDQKQKDGAQFRARVHKHGVNS